ncbi:LacI family DNA-binding transcriptional regulator, partial [Clostridium sp.]|uniref:LacI family DNA-binding transcriptional regulator n=1 Tax=Clostridium sp. TaxID=1506 RepID=UPI003463EC49
MKVTIKDVAKEANVAPSTVSRVLSNNPKISEETRKKVMEAIKKLEYKPNAIARSLANNKTRILGVVLPNEAQDLLSNHFFVQAMKGMSLYAQSKNYYITYAYSKDEESEKEYIRDFTTSKLVDGICLLRAKEKDETIEYLKEINFPFVVIGRPEDSKNLLWVDNDNFRAMYDVVNRLIQRGNRNIGFIGGREKWSVSKDRLKGYKMAGEINDIDFSEEYIIHMKEFNEEDGYKATKEILKNPHITALVTTDDLLAFGAIKALKEIGKNHVAIVGFNNTPLAEFQKPSLSSVDINAVDLGYYGIKLLIDKLEGKELK